MHFHIDHYNATHSVSHDNLGILIDFGTRPDGLRIAMDPEEALALSAKLAQAAHQYIAAKAAQAAADDALLTKLQG